MTRTEATKFINRKGNHLLLSLLYDLNLLPEQVKRGTKQEIYMMSVVEHWQRHEEMLK